ncbi:pellino protein [Rhizobium leguminosarum]|uniref:Pellino protein n=1 Tax=Rhizobium leguminosarum TaxID=384 RepID=A0AAE2MKZ6_RHILE|nr:MULTISPECIES: hypothetical protein [Rhizobium]MBB4291421.1 pellino protein [Rhizobium leguminosarum]MBB4296117.1 pellino protein [Rhizobium leguminosarum]MBB4308624.1 pellino protein [Rhizobium leguminosarum]MBB4416459.1 pellino protein [Rhizobium leguminosarum]MBB4430574.1 pellino protein [Rhizobium esperanzae]
MAKRSRSSPEGNARTAMPGSLGEALDEIGFQPLGRRIAVGKPTARGPRTSTDWAVPAIEFFRFTLPRAPNGNWKHLFIAAHEVACQALAMLGQATIIDGGAVRVSNPVLPAILPRWDDIATAVVWSAGQSGLLRYRRRGRTALGKRSSRLPRANIRAGYGCPPAYLGAEALPALESLGLISDRSWTAAAETILWRDDPYEAGMNFAKDKRFLEALDVARTSVPEEIAAKIRDIAGMPANEADGLVGFAIRYAHDDATKHESLVFLQDRGRRLLSELFAKRWRLVDGWLSAEECKRALFLELDPLSIQMSMEFGRLFIPWMSGGDVKD